MSEPNLTQQARTRLRRIEGQVRGIQGMLDRLAEGTASGQATPGTVRERRASAGEPCDSMLTQILAVRAAVEQVGLIILELHLRRCVLDGLPIDDDKLRDLRRSLKHWSRLSSAPR